MAKRQGEFVVENDELRSTTAELVPSPSIDPRVAESGNGQTSASRIEEGKRGHFSANVFNWFTRAVPPVLVFGLLASIGYWGHQNEWQFPAFSELTGNEQGAVKGWCAEHGVPQEICISCNAYLMPKSKLYGWCKEHGVAECVLEHPELAQLKETPVISPQDLDRARLALAIKERPRNDPLCKMHLRRIQFASREAADKAGIEIALVERGRIVESVEANGEIHYDPTLIARLASRAPGTVWSVEKNIGDPVKEGDLLALVDAAAVGQAKADLLQAVAQLNLHRNTINRLSGLRDVVAGRQLQEAQAAREVAEAAVRKAIQTLVNLGLPISLQDLSGKSGHEIAEQLQFLGLPPSVSAQLDLQQTTANLVPVLSPREGVVTARDVVVGEVIDTTRTLFTVVDNRRMWLLLDVPLEDSQYVRLGQEAAFRPDGGTQEHRGRLTWISTHIDAHTRTVQVRAELANDDGRLRDESFGSGKIMLRTEENAIVAPKGAIHWEGCCHVAFVRNKDFFADNSYKVFHTRMVRPGVTNGGYTEVIAGLLPGEVIVADGSGALRAELLKGNLGAG